MGDSRHNEVVTAVEEVQQSLASDKATKRKVRCYKAITSQREA